MGTNWTPASWRDKAAAQMPLYPNAAGLENAVARLSRLPPLVTSWEIERLRGLITLAAEGNAFVLQGGDCTESLEDCSTEAIVRQLKVLMQMSFVMMYGGRRRIVRIARMAGQFAKPRSAEFETRDGQTLPVYRGDLINRTGFTASDREPDPELLLRGYERAALTLNFVRALCAGGFADLHHPENWDLEFCKASHQARHFHEMVDGIIESLNFMETVAGMPLSETRSVEIYTSHEGLHLPYEQAQTRTVPRREGWYNLSTHFPWLGYRTQQLDGAHVEYFRGIQNPVGVKVGPGTDPDSLAALALRLNPHRVPGRLSLIHRFGVDEIERQLPPLVFRLREAQFPVLWVCDPMHGNTRLTSQGYKTRRFEDIAGEVRQAFEIHRRMGSRLGGVHLELTGDNVTECTGGARGLEENDLARAYRSAVDPRLNYDQAMELAFLISSQLRTV